MLAPIVLFTYRRKPNLTIESLLRNTLASKSILYIFSDNYKTEKEKRDIEEVRNYIRSIRGFRDVKIIERERNYGLARNIIDGVSKVIKKYGKVIVLEDDLVVSKDFLEYMNEALDFFKDDERIWSISGYTPHLKCLKEYKKDIYLSVRTSSWGWATWEDRWKLVDWNIKDWESFRKNKDAIKKFNLGGDDLFRMLELQMLGKIDSWAIVWCYNQFKHGKFTVYPAKSKVINIGFDDKGTHNTGKGDKWYSKLSDEKVNFEFVEVNEEIIRCFKNFYDPSLPTKIGYFLRKYGGYKIYKIIKKIYYYMLL